MWYYKHLHGFIMISTCPYKFVSAQIRYTTKSDPEYKILTEDYYYQLSPCSKYATLIDVDNERGCAYGKGQRTLWEINIHLAKYILKFILLWNNRLLKILFLVKEIHRYMYFTKCSDSNIISQLKISDYYFQYLNRKFRIETLKRNLGV